MGDRLQFDSTTDGKAIKIASMVDEHTRESLLHLAERSIAAECLAAELARVFAVAGGPPMVPRIDNGPGLISQALQQSAIRRSACPTSRRQHRGTVNDGSIESFKGRLRKQCLKRNHWNTLFEAWVVIGDFKDEHNHRHRHSAPGYRTPAEYDAAWSHVHYAMACEIN